MGTDYDSREVPEGALRREGLHRGDARAAGVDETYYRINDGPLLSLGEDGQPPVTTAGLENRLEYWSVDLEGNEENQRILTDIKMRRPASLNPAVITLSLIIVLSIMILWVLRRR